MDVYGFYTGQMFDAWRYLGAHKDGQGYVFRVYAPHARRITLIGEFNDWQDWDLHPGYNEQFWEVNVPQAQAGQRYLYKIWHDDNSYTEHCDPYGFGMDLRPAFCSVIRDLSAYQFHDSAWMRRRSDCKDKPLHIYEIHLGSWRQDAEKLKKLKNPENPDQPKNSENSENSENPENQENPEINPEINIDPVQLNYNYEEIADLLIPYLKDMGYNYIELMPIAEYPCDESWGYQSTGFYAPTARYGTADQLKALIDKCHQNQIGVLLDFVPVHFAVDSYGLGRFDGTPLYEYPNDSAGISEWGSYNFIHSRGEIMSFLQSNACYWLEEFHFDGLRMDAISRMIYWYGRPECGVNNKTLEFVRNMNAGLKQRFPSCILCAEDSTDFQKVTAPVEYGGLGFDYKWDMGYMHDTLDFFRTDPLYRYHQPEKLTFSMMYYPSECYLLPFSHDENVHGKATIMQKMHGEYENKFPQARTFYLYNAIHPGKMLDFMGSEFGQLREWDEKREQDWEMLKYPIHDAFHEFIKKLNHLYLEHSAFYERDYTSGGFDWRDSNQNYPCVYAIQRYSSSESLLAVFNFAGAPQENYTIHCDAKKLTVLLDSNAENYGGTMPDSAGTVLEPDENQNFTFALPAFTGICFQVE